MNTSSSEIKALVKEKYGQIAEQSYEQNASSCCGASCGCSTVDNALMAENYTDVKGYHAEADLGLGCGLPTQFAHIKPGNTVIDLGSGAGNDCFVARAATGATGKVIGVDMTEKMISKARANAEKLGYNNVEFRLGEIENLPVSDNTANVVVSNCVMNLVPDKTRAFAETFRVLKPGGHFSISDIVLRGNLPDGLRKSAEMYAGCVSGAIQHEAYLDAIRKAGFENIQVQKDKVIHIPDEILKDYLSDEEILSYHTSSVGIHSITVYAEKPATGKEATACCEPGCCN
ncbi:MAG: arsenite methyltransferase [Cyclobacteriaceae bacterium]|jgi:arsenite methyltransferase